MEQLELDLDSLNLYESLYVMKRNDGKWMLIISKGEIGVFDTYEDVHHAYRLWAASQNLPEIYAAQRHKPARPQAVFTQYNGVQFPHFPDEE